VARPAALARDKSAASGVDQVNLPSGSGYPSNWQTTAQAAGEEVVMHGDSRHAQSRPWRGPGRNAAGAGAERARAAGPLPEPAGLARVLEPVVRAAGMDLESVRVSTAGRRRLLKLVVDADGGAGLDQIAEVSREVSVRLDASGVMGEVPYTLEVSSPGVDRPLTEPRHWRRAQGRLVSVPLAAAGGGSSCQTGAAGQPPAVAGRILAAGDTAVTLDIEGDRRQFSYAELGPGRVQVEFGRAEDDGSTGAGRGPGRARAGNGGSQDGH
jgi:ribosome maturation factor RimP